MNNKFQNILATFSEAKDNIKTEEATKNALIMPFLSALDYNVFNPLEVVPEIIADIGEKKGEKIDYAIKSGNNVLMLIECKKCTQQLSNANISQIFRYFGACRVKMGVRIAVLTNGLEYQFFSDLENDNVLDIMPFFTFNILNYDDQQLSDLHQFSKYKFDLGYILSKADELKKRSAIEKILETYLTNPTDNFVKCVLTDMEFAGIKTQNIITTYSELISTAFNKLIRDRVSLILEGAIKQNKMSSLPSELEESVPPDKQPVSLERRYLIDVENQAYETIVNLLDGILPKERLFIRAYNKFSAILLDNSKKKAILKLYLLDNNNKSFSISTGTENLSFDIDVLDDIAKYIDHIKNSISIFEQKNANDTI
jgi:hypothetical protein